MSDLKTPPFAKRIPSLREFHGDKYTDNLEWLRDLESSEVRAHFEAENAWTDQQLADLEPLRETLFQELKARTLETDMSVPSRVDGYWYFARTEEGKNYAKTCRLKVQDRDDWTPPEIKIGEVLEGEECIFDAEAEAAKLKAETSSDFFSVGSSDITKDGKLMLYAVDVKGDERFEIRVRELLGDGEFRELDDVIPNTMAGASFDVSGHYIFYTTPDDSWRSWQLWRHKLGTQPSEDSLVYQEDDAAFNVGFSITADDRFLMLQSGSSESDEVRLLDSSDPEGKFEVFWKRAEGVEYSISSAAYAVAGNAEPRQMFFITHNRDSENFAVDVYSSPGTLLGRIASSDRDTKIHGLTCYQDFLLLSLRENTLNRTYIIYPDPKTSVEDWRREEVLPHFPSTSGITSTPELFSLSVGASDFDSPALTLHFSSFTTPSVTLLRDLRNTTNILRAPHLAEHSADSAPRELDREPDIVLKQRQVLESRSGEAFSSQNYCERRLWAKAKDGEKIPVSVIWRPSACQNNPAFSEELPQNAPVMLYGYGSYGSSIDPGFSIARLSFLDRGIVMAVAHVRGGEEMGKRWYREGKKLQKKNSFSDFVAVAEDLVARGVTARGRIVATGGSAGGLLVGAALNLDVSRALERMAEEGADDNRSETAVGEKCSEIAANARPLFCGVEADVPFVDALTSILKPELPLTIPEWEEWGDPFHDEEVYHYMKSYSPVENIKNVNALPEEWRPQVLATTSYNDTRVLSIEPAKWIQLLRENAYQALLKTVMQAGHAGASGRYASWRELAFENAWIIDRLLAQ